MTPAWLWWTIFVVGVIAGTIWCDIVTDLTDSLAVAVVLIGAYVVALTWLLVIL